MKPFFRNPRSAAFRTAAATTALGMATATILAAGNAWQDPENPVRQIFKGSRLDLWSLQPIRNPSPPVVLRAGWPRNPTDNFILSRLEKESLAPAPEADRRTLVRRLHLTLTGLPPTPEEIDSFITDPSPEAFETRTDQLLASPAFGVHWARWWMDLVRYSDSNGYDWDEFRPQMWRYRDYIIRSLNQDKPLNQFITEQLAGDELLSGPPQDSAGQDALIATGFLRTGPWDNSSVLFNEQHKTRAALMADLTETTGSAFLGLTLNCCRCHDHKTDPLTHADHYRFRAFFSGVEFADSLPLDHEPEQKAIRDHNEKLDALTAGLKAGKASLLELPDDLPKDQQEAAEKKARKALPASAREELEAIESQISEAVNSKRAFTTGVIMTSGKAAETIAILANGDPDQAREPVEPGFPSVFAPGPAPISDGRRRLTLANWITAPENPLTARVLANHLWIGCFGQGLVTTPSDFGYSGRPPSHPELLDYLASTLKSHDWSPKKTIRQLVTSTTWRQTSFHPDTAARQTSEIRDASNSLLSRMNPRRLTAESLRDSMLAASGLLIESHGGPPVWPPLPPEILQANPAFLDDNAEKTKGWYPAPPEKLPVRSVFLVQKRSVRLPFMEAFDQPDNFSSCSQRSTSTVAPQAFALMNNPLMESLASALAERATRETAGMDPTATLHRAWLLACGRPPLPAETEILTRLLHDAGLPSVCRAIFNTNAFVYVD